jgi:hypothetical protein
LRRWNKGDDTEATFVDDNIINEDADNEQVVMVMMTMMEEMMLVDVISWRLRFMVFISEEVD